MSKSKKTNSLDLTGEHCHTDGSGLWSSAVRTVALEFAELSPWNELRIYFDTSTWNVKESGLGLIYTDQKFEKEFQDILRKKGFSEEATSSVAYSEAGMQGDDYVSMDVEDEFCDEWKKMGLSNTGN